MRESGSLAVLGDVNFFFIPSILAQKESRREPPSGWGGFKFMPCFFAEARPLAFNPPFGFFPSFLVHAGVLAIYNFQARLVDVLQHWHNNLLTEVACECFAPNMGQADVHINIDLESELRGTITEQVVFTDILPTHDTKIKQGVELRTIRV